MTCCGFPRVTLEGSLDDWRALRAHAEALVMTRCSAKFAAGWCAALLPLLDKFVAEYEAGLAGSTGADEPFWNSMVKRRDQRLGLAHVVLGLGQHPLPVHRAAAE